MACGTRRTASITTFCACPTAAQRVSRSARWSACCRSAPTTAVEKWQRERVPRLMAQIRSAGSACRSSASPSMPTGPGHFGVAERGIMALVNRERLRRILTRMLDEKEFLSPYGIRSLSRYHADHPYVFSVGGQEYRVGYLPAESDSGMFGGNSNWRGPIWMPVNALIIRALAALLLVLRRQFQNRVPDRLGQVDEPVRGRARDRQSADAHLSSRREPAAGRSSAGAKNSRPIRTGGTICCSTSTSTATTAPASAPAIRPDGPASSRT